jgi:DNA-binding response OmpR family regulator
VKPQVGILSGDKELFEHCSSRQIGDIIKYRSFESLKSEETDILLVDAGVFEQEESIQFYLSKIRKKLQGIPVLLIIKGAYKEIFDLEWFFDDFIFYPFRKAELGLRIEKMLLRLKKRHEQNNLTIGEIVINLKEYAVYQDEHKFDLTYKEFELLRYLVENRGKVFSRKDLLNRIWGVEYIGGTRTVDVHIRRLRSKLGGQFNSIIETVRNVGYRCVE